MSCTSEIIYLIDGPQTYLSSDLMSKLKIEGTAAVVLLSGDILPSKYTFIYFTLRMLLGQDSLEVGLNVYFIGNA